MHRAPTRAYEQEIALKADVESFRELDELVSLIGDRSTCPQSFSQRKTTTLHKARLRNTLILVYGKLCGPPQKAYFMGTHLWLKSIIIKPTYQGQRAVFLYGLMMYVCECMCVCVFMCNDAPSQRWTNSLFFMENLQ